MTAPLRWSLAWSWGGESGTVEDVQVTLSERASLFGSTPSARTATVECVLPIDASALANRSHPRTATGILRCNDRLVLSSTWTGFEYDPINASSGRSLVSISLGESDADDRSQFPPAFPWRPGPGNIAYGFASEDAIDAAIRAYNRDHLGEPIIPAFIDQLDPYNHGDLYLYITPDTFGDAPTLSSGQAFPWVFGAPGNGALLQPGSPAWFIDVSGATWKLAVAGHACDVGTVTILGPDALGSDTMVASTGAPILTTTTPSGSVISYVEVDSTTGLGSIAPDPSKPWYACWDDGAPQPGGAGDLLVNVYALASNRVDVMAWQSVAHRLNAYIFAGYVDSPTTASLWLQQAILPLLPVSPTPGPFGHRPAVWPWVEAGATASGPRVIEGQGVVSDGRVTYTAMERETNRLVLRYGRRADTGAYVGTTSAGTRTTAYAASKGQSGAATTWEADSIWDAGTAQALASVQYRLGAFSPRTRSLTITDWARYGPGGDAELYPGREVRYTDAACGWTDRAACVVEVESSATGRRVMLWLRDDPLTDLA